MPSKYANNNPIVHHHIVLKPHHKKLIIGGSSLIVILMISLSIFTYLIFTRMEVNNALLQKKLTNLEAETQANINTLSENLIQTRENVDEIGSQIGIINEEFAFLKASAGEDFSEIIEQVIPGVVTIRTDVSQGTGFIIDSRGYIVTNYHVVENARAALVITSDNENNEVSLIGYNPELDIALLKISGTFNALELDNSDNVQVGEKVIAIGNPLGLQFSVSQGIVSAVHREGPNDLKAYIQTDAALNP